MNSAVKQHSYDVTYTTPYGETHAARITVHTTNHTDVAALDELHRETMSALGIAMREKGVDVHAMSRLEYTSCDMLASGEVGSVASEDQDLGMLAFNRPALVVDNEEDLAYPDTRRVVGGREVGVWRKSLHLVKPMAAAMLWAVYELTAGALRVPGMV